MISVTVHILEGNYNALKYITLNKHSVRSTWGLGPTMTARGQSISIAIGMLSQTLIMSRQDQLSRLDARI
jgi:hypothetical protein